MGKERPILFSGEMVRAILDGRKSQTRRVINPVRGFEQNNICKAGMPYAADSWAVWWHSAETERVGCLQTCPYGVPGDRLWVRETLRRDPVANVWYYAAGKPEDLVMFAPEDYSDALVWAHHKERDVCVSIHMPRWASRINLEIINVRVERIQDISFDDCLAEGVIATHFWEKCKGETVPNDLGMPSGDIDMDRGWIAYAKEAYRDLWNSINEKRGFGWKVNPWCWVVEFKSLAK